MIYTLPWWCIICLLHISRRCPDFFSHSLWICMYDLYDRTVRFFEYVSLCRFHDFSFPYMMYMANGTGQFEPVFYSASGTETIPLCLSCVRLKFDYTIVCWSFLYCEILHYVFVYYLLCIFLFSTGILPRDICHCMYPACAVCISCRDSFHLFGTCVTYVSRVFIFPVLLAAPKYSHSSGVHGNVTLLHSLRPCDVLRHYIALVSHQ